MVRKTQCWRSKRSGYLNELEAGGGADQVARFRKAASVRFDHNAHGAFARYDRIPAPGSQYLKVHSGQLLGRA
jgi:hypothetical protein